MPDTSWRPAGTPSGSQRATELGADATVNLDTDDLVAAFKEATGGDGPTYVVDTLWGPPAVAAIQAATPGWRLVQIGQSAGAEVSVPSAPIRGKMGEVYGFTDYAVPRAAFREHYLRLVEHAAAGRDPLRHRDVPAGAGRGSVGASGGRRGREDRGDDRPVAAREPSRSASAYCSDNYAGEITARPTASSSVIDTPSETAASCRSSP